MVLMRSKSVSSNTSPNRAQKPIKAPHVARRPTSPLHLREIFEASSTALHGANSSTTTRASIEEEVTQPVNQESLTPTEVDSLLNSWTGNLKPINTADILGRHYKNVSELMSFKLFWQELLDLNYEPQYQETQVFITEVIPLVMNSLHELQSDEFQSQLTQMSLAQKRIFDTDFDSLHSLQRSIIRLFQFKFGDAFNVNLEYCWTKLLTIVVLKLTSSSEDLVLKSGEFIYANEDALLPTTVLAVRKRGGYSSIVKQTKVQVEVVEEPALEEEVAEVSKSGIVNVNKKAKQKEELIRNGSTLGNLRKKIYL